MYYESPKHIHKFMKIFEEIPTVVIHNFDRLWAILRSLSTIYGHFELEYKNQRIYDAYIPGFDSYG